MRKVYVFKSVIHMFYIYIYIYIYTHTHTHTHTPPPSWVHCLAMCTTVYSLHKQYSGHCSLSVFEMRMAFGSWSCSRLQVKVSAYSSNLHAPHIPSPTTPTTNQEKIKPVHGTKATVQVMICVSAEESACGRHTDSGEPMLIISLTRLQYLSQKWVHMNNTSNI